MIRLQELFGEQMDCSLQSMLSILHLVWNLLSSWKKTILTKYIYTFFVGFRVIRVFNREGQLQYTSEKVEQLEQSLSWKSSGASGLITSGVSLVQQGKQQVAFFEKNGLRHGEFEISAGSKVRILSIFP